MLAGFRAFQGERLLRRPIEGPRTATAWLAADVMLGGEITGAARPAGPGTRYNQFHPATIHWRVLGGEVGWMRLHAAPAVDAEAAKAMLTISSPAAGDFAYEVLAPRLDSAQLARDRWVMPRLTVSVDTDATGFAVVPAGGRFDIRYTDATLRAAGGARAVKRGAVIGLLLGAAAGAYAETCISSHSVAHATTQIWRRVPIATFFLTSCQCGVNDDFSLGGRGGLLCTNLQHEISTDALQYHRRMCGQ